MKSHVKRRFFIGAALCVPALVLTVLSATTNNWGQIERAQRADAILIFGASVRANGQASPVLRARTRHAFELWKRGLAPKIVCTGGLGHFAPAESQVQKQLLQSWGVPETAILIEEKSTSTRENALFAAQLLPTNARVIAVSDPFHLWRCQRDCQAVGLRAFTSPARGAWENLRLWSRFFISLREALLIVRSLIWA